MIQEKEKYDKLNSETIKNPNESEIIYNKNQNVNRNTDQIVNKVLKNAFAMKDLKLNMKY